MPDASLKSTFNRPPEAAQKYLQGKGYAITESWRDLPAEAHARAFTVARAARLEVLQSIREELQRAMDDGLPFQAFKQNLKPRLQAMGWWGKAIDKETGEISPYPGTGRPIELGSPRRLETIYRTNMQTAYMAGRWKRFEAQAKRAPYVQYIAVMDDRTRPSHAELHQRVFRIDDPIWAHIAPPNGFNCRCRARNLTERDLKRYGLEVSNSDGYLKQEEVEDRQGKPITRTVVRLPGMSRAFSPDIGWDYNPGRAASRWDKNGLLPDGGGMLPNQKTWRDYGRPDLRDVADIDRLPAPQMLAQAPSRAEAVDVLAAVLGLSRSTPVRLIKTPVEPVELRYEFLPHLIEKESNLRERYANFVLPTLTDPFEVWLTAYADTYRSRYIGLFRGDSNLLVVVRHNLDGSLMWNIMQASDKSMNKQRQGETLLYARGNK